MWIAWNISVGWPPNTIEEKIELFYQRALGWQLHIADLLANGGQPLGKSHSVEKFEHSGFAVLQICLSHFETIGHYERRSIPPNAKGSNGYFFKEGVRSVFPQLLMGYGGVFDELLARLYSGARCGLYHNSMTVKDVGLGNRQRVSPSLTIPRRNVWQ